MTVNLSKTPFAGSVYINIYKLVVDSCAWGDVKLVDNVSKILVLVKLEQAKVWLIHYCGCDIR